jgi:hypothetical protein
MTGYFWKTKDANSFGAFTPSLGTGLYHVAAAAIAPGMKLWSYGVADSAWATLSTAKREPYVELQGGPIQDQSIKLTLASNETRSHIEFWIPTDTRLDIHALKVPEVTLRPVADVPLFSWARPATVTPWTDLAAAFKNHDAVPPPPALESNRWAPSGMENLGEAFEWAIANANQGQADLWRFHFGAWLAGREDPEGAITQLSASRLGAAKALLARLCKSKGDLERARQAFAAIQEPWLQLHPQIVVERDKTLRAIGATMLPERERWLSQVDALADEWVIERRIQLLIDQGRHQAAKDLLLATPFQKVHQTYTRTGLWKQITDALGLPSLPIPAQLGEDRLATFGAYREYE